jgi:hypothetical protein
MGGVRNDLRKSFKKDDNRAAIDPKYYVVLICLMSFIQNIYFMNHFVNVFIGFLDDRSRSSAVHGRMGAVRNDTRKSFKKDDKRTVITLWVLCLKLKRELFKP